MFTASEGKELRKAMQGRGKATIIERKPGKPKNVADDEFATIRSENSRKAIASLKQARRLEQTAFRMELMIKRRQHRSESNVD